MASEGWPTKSPSYLQYGKDEYLGNFFNGPSASSQTLEERWADINTLECLAVLVEMSQYTCCA